MKSSLARPFFQKNRIFTQSLIKNRVTTCLLIAGSLFFHSSVSADTNTASIGDSVEKQDWLIEWNDKRWWQKKSARRNAKLQRYLEENAAEFSNFKDTPLGSTGIPAIMLTAFPHVLPDIWGEPEDHFKSVGFLKDPFNPEKKLPLGLGHTNSGTIIPVPVAGSTINVNIQAVQLTCMGCHTGRVEDENGNTQVLVGAPNNHFDRFRFNVFRTVTHPNYNADNFRAAILASAATGPGWLYPENSLRQQEALETAIFLSPGVAENFLDTLRQRVIAAASRSAQAISATTYGGANAPDFNGPQHGLIDAYSNASILVLDPSVLTQEELANAAPPRPAFADIMSTWLQRDRPIGQWDGSVVSSVHRNVESAIAVTTNPSTINLDNAVVSNDFAQDLPPPAYPFDVSKKAAKKGRKLFKEYCAGCHYPGTEEIFDAEYVGTDPNRANALTDYTLPRLTAIFRASCPDILVECNNEAGEPFSDDEIIRMTGGYQALPLQGIWARAPYLHNGSVPTLEALLTGNRPAQFYRGNASYDQEKVGFTWDVAESDNVMLYDTTLDGFSNAGHDTPEFNGDVDWANEPQKLYYLLEYLKTL